MAETVHRLDQQIEALLAASSVQNEGDNEPTDSNDETAERSVIDVDLFRLEGGALLFVPSNGTNPLDTNVIESVAPTTETDPRTETTRIPVTDDEQQEERETPQELEPEGTKRQVKPSVLLVPLVLLCLLASGGASYLFLLPLTATATVTITPKAKSLHTDTMFTIATNPKAGEVQGRPLVPISFTKSTTVPATGHAHNDATSATGVVTFYNADSQSYTIPAGTSFTVGSVTVVTDTPVIVQAVVPPMLGTAYASAHVIQAGVIGNIPVHTMYTRCCGSPFLTATNTSAFTDGQDARSYNFVQTSDIQNAATDLLRTLTPQATAALNREARQGEQLVTPLCTSRTSSNQEPGTEDVSVTVSVTQTCTSVAYTVDSLQQVATSTLTRSLPLANYQQVGTTQVTVNGSTYTNHTATLKVSFSGIWIYRFTQAQVQQLTHQIAGENQQEAKATLMSIEGVAHVSIHLQRVDFRNDLPADPKKISMQFFSIVS